jgi:site-specific DNA-methyltransferase (adenine-specific)
MEIEQKKNVALLAEEEHKTAVESAEDYVENFDILETITNVGNDEVFTPRKTCDLLLNALPEEVWTNPNYHWLNPATKNGVFEREIALRLNKGLKDIIPDDETRKKHILQDMIYSIGQTKFTANVARRTLYYCSQANRRCDGIKAQDGHYVNGYAIGNGSWFKDEEGNIKTPNTNHDFGSDGKCRFCGIGRDSKYVSPTQREQYAYEFIHIDPSELADHLSQRFFGGNKEMKFDIIIGNPPYQLSDGGAQASACPIYQLFVDQAKALNPKYLCMIIPARWMASGKGLDDFREEMLEDKHIRLLHDFSDPKECFPSNEIKGGVCYFLWNRDEEGKCHIVTHREGDKTESTRYLKEDEEDVFIRDERLIPILKKVQGKKLPKFSKIASPLRPYGLRGDVFQDPSKYGLPPFSSSPIEKGFAIHGLDAHHRRVVEYAPANYPFPKKDLLSGYKLFVARNQGDGTFGEKLSQPILAGPKDACTETFIVFGPFASKKEMVNCASYFRSKFFRCMMGIRKVDQNASKRIYDYVPLLDFSKEWKDQELYQMFGFTPDEISFIESSIEEMISYGND